MGSSKKKSRGQNISNQTTNSEEEQLPIPWKISLLLVLLAIVVIFLFQIENHADIIEATNAQNSKREIPDPEKLLPPSMSKIYIFKHASISSDSQVCSDNARNLMREKNGNIFDAMISTMICNSLTNLQSMGLFGGFIMTAYTKEKISFVMDAQMTSPRNFPKNIKNLSNEESSLSIANFAGFLKGIYEIHKTHASLNWQDIIEPTIEVCRKGFILTKHLKDSIETNQRITNDTYMRSLFYDRSTNKIKRVGSKIVNSKHCDFLEILSHHNSELAKDDDIFTGKIGEIIENDLREAGSIISIDDLKSYKLKIYERELIDLDENYSMLVPDTSAILVPSIIKILLKYQFNSTWFEDSEKSILLHHRITETFKHVFAKRSLLGDGDYVNVKEITKDLISNEFVEKIINSIDDEQVKNYIEDYGIQDSIPPEDHGTSHISIVAENGDAVAVTSSINFYFGAGMSGKSSGIIFNNGMDDFSYRDRDVNYFGLKETETNYPEPGKRPLSSMSPIILINRNTKSANLAIGAAGGSKILTALSLSILRFLLGTQDIKEIIDAPRLHHQMVPNVLEYEFGIPSNIITGLKSKGHQIKRYRDRGTIINAIERRDNSIYAISDYRKDSSGVAGY